MATLLAPKSASSHRHVTHGTVTPDTSPSSLPSLTTPPSPTLSPFATPVDDLIESYRLHGYRIADLDPLGLANKPELAELSWRFHATALDSSARYGIAADNTVIEQIEQTLRRIYCDAIGVDCTGVRDASRRAWLFARMESGATPGMNADARVALLEQLASAEMWELIADERYEGAKRFSLQGCESLIPLMLALVDNAASYGLDRVFLGMPHRGRLNALVNIMGLNAAEMLARLDPASTQAMQASDLPYHLGATTTRATRHGDVTLTMSYNPSHLESAYPVVSGMTRAFNDENPNHPALAIVVHGDAAFAGQGVVTETLNMTRRSGYDIGGTIHLVVNNQIGFTTSNTADAVDAVYCTDIGRGVDAPVIRVNADRPEAVLRVAAMALDYRLTFGSDVIIDLVGYRRLGHSEHDIPSLTQPYLQQVIASHPTVVDLYHAEIEASGSVDALREDIAARLMSERGSKGAEGAVQSTTSQGTSQEAASHAALHLASDIAAHEASHAASRESSDKAPRVAPQVASHDARDIRAMSPKRLTTLLAALTHVPANMRVHDVIEKMVGRWAKTGDDPFAAVDWCLAENLAFASLLDDGVDIRISGMDVGRGTFMQRQAVWHSQHRVTGAPDRYVPLRHIAARQGRFDIFNSPLTEEAVLGFEYGYSVQAVGGLTVWEAQYGDFVNGAQVYIDQYIASGEAKWGYQSGLVVALPHGHEGVGPEHSNAYLGRFLQLCADDNMRVVVPSTSAQWFHLLRAQAANTLAKPLIVMSPKSQLYGNTGSHSPLHALADGAFEPVLRDDAVADASTVKRVVLCAGKVFYELDEARRQGELGSVAIIRIEQLYPFPARELAAELAAFANLEHVVWAQEEDANQGAWRSIRDDLDAAVAGRWRVSNVCRTTTASGSHSSVLAHSEEQRRIVARALT